ncbi:MAG TPA: lipoprotein [Leptospiraceae bacterium]|nr:lipoprotein [Leptospiraceae bacterium]HNF15387.1 lipoprotein [Leptospiraceae bacterium]HNF27457.1 lipoprotein [Leptospiraceae bacterium]HNI97639.1 lipoprotein [Leptospiraceae bacterium]HNM06452.1 lipoprotein [Leptospiraceae bacterium]
MKKIILLIISALFLSGCSSESADGIKKRYWTLVLLLNPKSVSSTPISCTGTVTYSSLSSNSVFFNCRSCHSGGAPSGGYDISTLTGMKTRVSSTPETSLLYQKITTGSMAVNSNTSFNQLVYCWIKGGALP